MNEEEIYNEQLYDVIIKHVEDCIGDVDFIYHTKNIGLVHVDLLVVKPTETYNFVTLVTAGMSYKPMILPESCIESDCNDCELSELYWCLPPEQYPDKEGRIAINNLPPWNYTSLRDLAYYPHECDTWFRNGHTVPETIQTIPYHGYYLASKPRLLPDDFCKLTLNGKTIWFYPVIPLTESEYKYVLTVDNNNIEELFDENGVTELLDVNGRKSVI
jgi:hypothetical protein